MKTVRTLIALVAMSGLVFAAACSDDDGGNSNPEVCTGGADEDGDGLVDCADPDCASSAYCNTNPCDNDGVCDAGENYSNCPNDCPATTCDNDGVCDAGENYSNCPNDCPVCDNDNICDAGETAQNCPNDCATSPTCEDVQDLLDQDGCNTGEKCTVVSQTALGCATEGTVADYAECGTQGTDDCQAGAICAGTGTGPSSCLPFCDQTHPCTGGACAATIQTPAGQATLCLPYDGCEPIDSTGCAQGEGCYILDQQGNSICGTPGTVAIGQSCTNLNDCVLGATCAGNPGVCTQWCSSTVACTSGTCTGIGTIPQHSDLGMCQ